MTFPLSLHGHTFEDAPTFAEAVLSDSIAGGGRVQAKTLPRDWLGTLVTEFGDRPLLVSLTAWLTRSDHAAGICEAVAIAQKYSLQELASVFGAALDGLSIGLLLQPNPMRPSLSVEDTLLQGLATLTDGTPDSLRVKLLGHLRHAGLRDEELSVLMRYGTKRELKTLLPGLIAEALPDSTQLSPLYTREQELMLTLGQVLASTPLSYRTEVWEKLKTAAPLLATRKDIATLFTS